MSDTTIPLEQAQAVASTLNSLLRELPDHHVVTNGTKVEVVAGKTRFNDPGLDYVIEFQQTFGAPIGMEPRVPEYSGGFAAGEISKYQFMAAKLGESLKRDAADALRRGDAAGALVLIRLQLIQEELAELAEGLLNRNIVECLDALVDLSYVVDGAYLTLGLAPYKLSGLAEVHRSNMSKLGADGEPVLSDAGRVMKGPDYTPPDLGRVLGIFNHREPGEFGEGATIVRVAE